MTTNATNQFGGDWTQQKLKILQGYLQSYTTALKNQNFDLLYVDAFAGTGYFNPNAPDNQQGKPVWGDELDEQAKRMFQGSTRLSLEVNDNPFNRFLFVEQNNAFVQSLNGLRRDFPDKDIQIWQGDANQVLPLWCSRQNERLGTPWQGERAVVFLDPFATEVEWTTVASIADTKSVDVWVLFPISALTRNLPNERMPYAGNAALLDRVFGGPEWHDLYLPAERPPAQQLGLFAQGEAESQIVRDDQQAIVEIYMDKMRSVFPAVATAPKWFYNSRNSPLFALMFASASRGRGEKIALRIANHLLTRW